MNTEVVGGLETLLNLTIKIENATVDLEKFESFLETADPEVRGVFSPLLEDQRAKLQSIIEEANGLLTEKE